MTNEQIVQQIQNGSDVTDNMQMLYEQNLPLIRKIVKPYTAYEDMEDMLQVGVITQTHGIKGEVKVFPTTDDAQRFKKLKKVTLDNGKERRELEITSVKFFKNLVILKFKGIDDINEVEKYKKAALFVTREDAVPLGENEYFIADLIGLRVVSEEGEELGTLDDVLQTGANDVYVVKNDKGEEILVPAIKDCVKNVDIDGGEIILHLLPGLR